MGTLPPSFPHPFLPFLPFLPPPVPISIYGQFLRLASRGNLRGDPFNVCPPLCGRVNRADFVQPCFIVSRVGWRRIVGQWTRTIRVRVTALILIGHEPRLERLAVNENRFCTLRLCDIYKNL